MANDYEINYEDERFQDVEQDKEQAMSELDETYDGMIDESQKYYDEQIQASKDYAEEQSRLQQEQTDFAIDQIEQEKENAQKDYTKEQSGAYVDWQKQSNEYGVNAEKEATAGLAGSGFSESSQVSMYNTYQSRVATARESYSRAVQNYNNAITQARLQNNSILAEIAAKALEQQLQLALEGMQYKNSLLLDKANKKTQIESEYWSRYQDVLDQINHENSLAEQIRQFNEQMAEEKRQYDESMAFEKEQFNWQKSRASSGGGSSGGGGGSGGDDSTPRIKSPNGTPHKTSGDNGKVSSGKYNEVTLNDGNGGKKHGGKGGSIDMKSASAAAGGPVSAKTMDKKVRSGEVVEVAKNGKIYFQRQPIKHKLQNNLYSKFKF